MSVVIDMNKEAIAVELVPVGTRTSTFTGQMVDISEFIGKLKVVLSASSGSGTSPVLAGKIQTGDMANGSDAVDVPGAVFSTVTTNASLQSIAVDTRACKRYIRFVGTIEGTTPSFMFSVIALGQRQVM